MPGPRAIEAAFGLTKMPTLAPAMRAQPLPPDVLFLIRLAADQAEAEIAAGKFGVSPEALRETAIMYLQQVVLHSGADSHRALGVERAASWAEIKEHKRWLLKWLHPDRNRNEWEATLFQRVTDAWDELEKARTVPGATGIFLPPEKRDVRDRFPAGMRLRWVAQPVRRPEQPSRGGIRFVGLSFLAVALAFALLYMRGALPLEQANGPATDLVMECLPFLPCPEPGKPADAANGSAP